MARVLYAYVHHSCRQNTELDVYVHLLSLQQHVTDSKAPLKVAGLIVSMWGSVCRILIRSLRHKSARSIYYTIKKQQCW